MDITTILLGFSLKLFSALTAFVIARLALRNLDKASGFDFKHWINNTDENSKSIYLGSRIIAVCILFGLIIL